MPASLERIRKSMDVAPTAQDKGLTLTLRITAYDNGMVQLDGIPINDHVDYDQVVGWTGALEVLTATVNEFQRQVTKRKKDRAGTV
jgi:nitrogenase molybdenum-iron protein alpha/beta subunit